MLKKILFVLCLASYVVKAQNTDATFVRDNYTKIDTTIIMRDGVKLYTVISTLR